MSAPQAPISEEVSRATADVLERLAGIISGRVYSPRIKLLSIDQVCEATGLSERTIYVKVKNETFPRPVREIGKNMWRESTLIAWMDAHDPDGARQWAPAGKGKEA